MVTGSLSMWSGQSVLSGTAQSTGNVTINTGQLAAHHVSVAGSVVVDEGIVTVRDAIMLHDDATITGGLIVQDTGMVLNGSDFNSLFLDTGSLLVNGADTNFMVNIRSTSDSSAQVRLQTVNGSEAFVVDMDGAISVLGGATTTDDLFSQGHLMVEKGGIISQSTVTVAGSVGAAGAVNVQSGGVHAAGNTNARNGIEIVGYTEVRNGDVHVSNGTQVAGAVEVGIAGLPSNALGLTVSDGISVNGSTIVMGDSNVQFGGISVSSGVLFTTDVGITLSGGVLIQGREGICVPVSRILSVGSTHCDCVDAAAQCLQDGSCTPNSSCPAQGLGIRVESGGAEILEGGMLVNGGLVVDRSNLELSGGLNIQSSGVHMSGGANIEDGITVVEGGMIIDQHLAIKTDSNSQVMNVQGSSVLDAAPVDGTGDTRPDIFTISGNYSGDVHCGHISITIDSVSASADTFSWTLCTKDNCESPVVECDNAVVGNVIVEAQPLHLIDGIFITFAAASGHILGHVLSFDIDATHPIKLSNADGTNALVADQTGAILIAASASFGNTEVVNGGLQIEEGSMIVNSEGLDVNGGMFIEASAHFASGLTVSSGTVTFSDGVKVQTGGLDAVASFLEISGGAAFADNVQVSGGLLVNGDASIAGGLTLDHLSAPSGVHSQSGGVYVVGGANVTAGALILDGINISSNGLVVSGGLSTGEGIAIVDTGLHILADGLTVAMSGINISGSVLVRNAGITAHAQLHSRAGMHITEGMHVTGGTKLPTGAVQVNAGGLIVQEDGISIVDNGLSVTSGQMDVLLGGLQANGGATISSEGVVINSGGIRVHSGGASSVGGLFSGGTLHIDSDGLSVHGGTSVTGKMVVSTGGVEITDGFQVHSQGVEVAGGLTTGGRFTVDAGGARTLGNGVAINTIASDTFVAVQGRSSVQLAATHYTADPEAVQFHGTYVGAQPGYIEIVISSLADETSTSDAFSWSKCVAQIDMSLSYYSCSTLTGPVAISSGQAHLLTEGISVTFSHSTGYALSDGWVAELTLTGPLNTKDVSHASRLSLQQTGGLLAHSSYIAGRLSIDGGIETSGSFSLSGGLVSGQTVEIVSGGLRTANGLMQVLQNGARSTGSIVVPEAGMTIMSGASIFNQSIQIQGGLALSDSNLIAHGGIAVHGDNSSNPSNIHGGINVVGGMLYGTGGLSVHDGLTASSGVSLHSNDSSHANLMIHNGSFIIGALAHETLFGVSAEHPGLILAARASAGELSTSISSSGTVQLSGHMRLSAGAVVSGGPLTISSGGAHIAYGNIHVSGGTSILNGGLIVKNDGISVTGGSVLQNGLHISDGNVNVSSGGITILDEGCSVAGGVSIACGETILSGGMHVIGDIQLLVGSAHVDNGAVIGAGDVSVSGGASIFDGGMLLNGTLDIHSNGLSVDGDSLFCGQAHINEGLALTQSDLNISGNMVVIDGNVDIGSGNLNTILGARGQSSLGAVDTAYVPEGRNLDFQGPFTGSLLPARLIVTIDGLGNPDTFGWSKCQYVNNSCVYGTQSTASGVEILVANGTTMYQNIIEGISIRFSHATGNSISLDTPSSWIIDIVATNVFSARNAEHVTQVDVGQDGALHAIGAMHMAGSVNVVDGLRLETGELFVDDLAQLNGGMAVAGTSGVIIHSHGLAVDGILSAVDTIKIVDGELSVTEGIHVNGEISVHGGLVADGNVSVGGTVHVKAGDANIQGPTTLQSGLVSAGKLNVTEGLVVEANGLTSSQGISVVPRVDAPGGGVTVHGGFHVGMEQLSTVEPPLAARFM